MAIKTSFTIKDLENLSGVKSHTIRIWEKRYNLFEPQRSETNIRSYDLASLQKILSIATLNKSGVKISKIAKISNQELIDQAREVGACELSVVVNDFIVSMIKFDYKLFNKAFDDCVKRKGFEATFQEEIFTLLMHIGELWVSKTISPVHERFISTLVKQKLLLGVEQNAIKIKEDSPTFVLYLPVNEMHDIGLLYIHYKLIVNGFRSVFLGNSVPVEDLKLITSTFSKVSFISYFTVEPAVEDLPDYLANMNREILSNSNSQFHVLGKKTQFIDKDKLLEGINVHPCINHLFEQIL